MSVDSRPSIACSPCVQEGAGPPGLLRAGLLVVGREARRLHPRGVRRCGERPATKAAAAAVAVDVAPAVEAIDDRPSLEEVLEKLLSFDGAMCVAVVDSETGMILGKAGSGVEIDLAAAGASVILRARLASIKALGSDEQIDDVLISTTSQVQIIHPLPDNPSIFTYLIGDKSKSSLAMARYKANEADLLIQL